MNILKWFWANIDFRKGTFGGRQLANPFTIIRKIIVFPFLFIAVIIYCLLIALFDWSIESGIEAYSNNF